MASDAYRDLLAHFTDPARYTAIDPKRAIWLTEGNIRNLAKDERFMAQFRRARETK